MENDKYKEYFNDEGEFLIPFEQIQRGKLPRKVFMLRRVLLACFSITVLSILFGLAAMFTHMI